MRRTFVLCFVLLFSCSPTPSPAPGATAGGLTGTLYHAISVPLDIHKLNLATGEDVKLGTGDAPIKTPEGTLIYKTPLDLVEASEDLASPRVIVKGDDTLERSNKGFHAPALSPDGTRIAYTNVVYDALYVVQRSDGKVVARFEPTGASESWERPTWTPDGRLVVAGGFSNPGLFLSDAALTKMTRFDPGLAQPRSPSVSPDGTKVAFILNKRVHVIGLDGSGLLRVDPTDDEDNHPEWSPDGSQIAYRGKAGTIKFVPATGGTPTNLFDVYPALAKKFSTISGVEPFDWK